MWRLYSALARAAGVELPLTVNDPRIVAARLRTTPGELAVLVNLSGDEIDAILALQGGASYAPLGAAPAAAVSRVSLAPFEVEVLARID